MTDAQKPGPADPSSASAGAPAAAPAAPPDPLQLLKSRSYLGLLGVAAVLGVPIAVLAYFFLELVSWLEHELYHSLPLALGFSGTPAWWPLPLLAVAGLLVGATIRYLPGNGGHSPADGLKVGVGPPLAIDVPGVALAALATLALGAVLGPEAPLIAIGGGLAALTVQTLKRDAPPMATVVIAAAGSFAAISTLLGSPIVGAFLLMEASGVGGPTLGLLLVPGLLASGLGYLIFVGLNRWTGFGTFSLALPNLPHFATPTIAEFGWALAIGVVAALLGGSIRWLALAVRPYVERNKVLSTPFVGVVVALMAMAFAAGTGKGFTPVLFSGQSELPTLVAHASTFTVGALALLIVCKSLAYSFSLSSFRGGPIFPAMFTGAAGGLLMMHLPGLPMVPAVAMGIGALTAVMLGLPLTSVLLASLLTASAGLADMPLVIVAVTAAYVASAHFAPMPRSAREAATSPAPAATAAAPPAATAAT